MSFAPCASCRRHVRVTDSSCPFCGCTAIGDATPAARGRIPRRLAAVFATAMIAGCSSTETPVYGAPAPPADSATDADTSVSDTGLPGTLYGGPPVDGGK